MPPGSIQSLPGELLGYILDSLDTKALSSLCLVSHPFLDHARPLLYRSFKQDVCESEEDLLHFGRTLTANPTLGTYVRSFGAHDWDIWGLEEEDPRTEADREWRERIDTEQFALLEDLFSLPDRGVEKLDYGPHIIALLLYQMPNLENLHLWLPLEGPDSFESMKYALSSWNLDERPFLSHLKTLELDWNDDRDGWEMATCQPLIERPSLEKLCGKRCSDDLETYNRDSFTSGNKVQNLQSNIRSIRLCHSVICENALEDFMAGFPYLEEFCLSVTEGRIGNMIEFDFSKAVKAFAQRSDSLKTLVWQFESNVHFGGSGGCEWTGTGDFSPLAQLEWLDVPEWLLFGYDQPAISVTDAFDHLPSSLSVLVIRHAEKLAVELAFKILEHKSSRFPNLESIAVLPGEEGKDTKIGGIEDLQSKCNAVNVALNEERYPSPHSFWHDHLTDKLQVTRSLPQRQLHEGRTL